MKPIPLLLALCGLAALSAQADVYLESKTFGNMTSKTWTSGLKQRSEMPNPMTGSPLVVITRVDQGVVWKLDLQHKIYEEKPIALPYTPPQKTMSAGETPAGTDSTAVEKLEIVKLPQTRTIAGFSSEGYQMRVGGKEMGEVWMADPTGSLAQLEKETQTYQTAYNRELYKNFPAAERTTMESGMKALAGMLKGEFAGLSQAVKEWPKGFMMAMEGISENEGGQPEKMIMFELLQVSVQPADAALFDVPSDFKKVDDLATDQTKELLKGSGLNLDELMKNLPK